MSRPPARRAATRRGAKPVQKRKQIARKKQPGLMDQALAALPVSQATLTRIATWGIVAMFSVGLITVATWFGVPQVIGVGAAQAVGEAGLRVDTIQINGLKRMNRMTVYQQVLDQNARAMPLVDLADVRTRLLAYPWIKDARVSRRLPDKLLIDIVEREPAAIWQNHGQLMLIDPMGVPLEPVSREAMPDLPLLIGDGANAQEPVRRDLMDSAPALKPLVRAATWVGNRRWDIIFDTGEKLQLPEGEKEARDALKTFAEKDGAYRLLGRGNLGFDMRDPDNLVIRRPAAIGAPAATGL
ncbi:MULTISPECIES: cell division protein FtsQ/DivIB [unclassified Sphingomonas]|uniref:cell division protein FtsQ/DivIB n=1 Tax=Sphingomonas TaxID=13687 RepID=UPI00095C2659|nr:MULTISPECIES: FtsQ-type POTRA domain-containing protein [unclassified Sphingomonas]MBN8811020.1 FtsQ-type POTRA domain-containing protein [Sphingomonas sp.]OJY54513.1 MAG: cell division protein FtsQ [Sphingomonas sp. 67-41]